MKRKQYGKKLKYSRQNFYDGPGALHRPSQSPMFLWQAQHLSSFLLVRNACQTRLDNLLGPGPRVTILLIFNLKFNCDTHGVDTAFY